MGKKAKGRGGGRDLNSFRKTLELLQAHVHELDAIKMEYHGEVSLQLEERRRGRRRRSGTNERVFGERGREEKKLTLVSLDFGGLVGM